MEKTISAAQFKATCLELMDKVEKSRTEIVITKRGKPAAKLVPYEAATPSAFGFMAGTATVQGDIVSSLDDFWDAEQD